MSRTVGKEAWRIRSKAVRTEEGQWVRARRSHMQWKRTFALHVRQSRGCSENAMQCLHRGFQLLRGCVSRCATSTRTFALSEPRRSALLLPTARTRAPPGARWTASAPARSAQSTSSFCCRETPQGFAFRYQLTGYARLGSPHALVHVVGIWNRACKLVHKRQAQLAVLARFLQKAGSSAGRQIGRRPPLLGSAARVHAVRSGSDRQQLRRGAARRGRVAVEPRA